MKQSSSLPVIRRQNTPWDISTIAGLADFFFFHAPWKFHPDDGRNFHSSEAYCDWNIPHGTLDTKKKIWVSLTQTPTS